MKPMEGIRVIELSTMLAGPMTARILAEWGADVIKVESMNGDAWRKQAGTTMSPCTKDANPNFDMQNLNKRFVSLNLRTKEGHDAMMKLLENADVLITNYRTQALEGMGLAYEQVKERFPRLIHAHVLGYGDKGPDKDRPGYDYTAFFSRSGLMADLPPAGAGPLVPIGGVGDHSVAVAMSGGIAAALYRREKTGVGDKVDVSLLQIGAFIGSTGILNGFNGRKLPRDRYDCGHAGSNTYQGSDGEWLYLAVIDFRRFPEFCALIGMPEIATDPKYSTPAAYYANKTELTHIFDKVFAQHPVAYWDKVLEEHDLPHEVLRHFKDVPDDPQAIANHYVHKHEYSDGTKTVFVNGPVHFASVDPEQFEYKPSREIGADTAEVLAELGYSKEKIADMYEKQEIR
ncbi:CaiB/BaiF CoA transferase family protein [Pseudoflavonifractor phocaeensis]|uniref:CaiB/BaiF CoA transferase family protein n=1 Tax=Pseudoflavonifractor phocaeensis TaxID=1870988 RepID=UPI001F375FFC|nr:CoA transferase [Pseudoflavonifractor phocaeensis]MCF2660551.1 CoA transferase [Pseudoflavonifractor phocaeensis]